MIADVFFCSGNILYISLCTHLQGMLFDFRQAPSMLIYILFYFEEFMFAYAGPCVQYTSTLHE